MFFDIETIQSWLDEIAESLPEEIFKDLNGGVLLLPQYKISPYAKADDLFIMGEYRVDRFLGRMINIYYGSFVRLYFHAPEHIVKTQLRHTLCHELTHHLESLAGERGLEIVDAERLQRYLNP
jgi:hypothetical protein